MIVQNYEQVAAEKVMEAEGVNIRVVIGKNEGAPNFVMRVFDVEPGATTPLHTHEWEHEVFVLSGKGRVYGGGEQPPLGQGDTVFIPPYCASRLVETGVYLTSSMV